MKKEIIDSFALGWWQAQNWNKIKWLGTPLLKNPMDLIVVQEILFETKPTVLIETGTCFGGSAIFYASILDFMGADFMIYTIDNSKSKPSFGKYESRIRFLWGSSIDPKIIEQIVIKPEDKVTVILDSEHTYDHVKAELEIYSKFVTVGQYIICEDTNVDDLIGWKRAAHQAVIDFQKEHPEFAIDKDKEKLEFTFNPDGFLRRIL
jgi:cephalosporin hydroxylase